MADSALDFVADDWLKISRGWMATFANCYQLPEEMKTPSDLQGQQVKIDGKEYRVLGVEMYVIGIWAPSYYRGHGFGLLIEGER